MLFCITNHRAVDHRKNDFGMPGIVIRDTSGEFAAGTIIQVWIVRRGF